VIQQEINRRVEQFSSLLAVISARFHECYLRGRDPRLLRRRFFVARVVARA
jgi:hypothetical protein